MFNFTKRRIATLELDFSFTTFSIGDEIFSYRCY